MELLQKGDLEISTVNEVRKLVEFGVNLDERIADGYYMAKALQLLQNFFNEPSILEEEMGKEYIVPENR